MGTFIVIFFFSAIIHESRQSYDIIEILLKCVQNKMKNIFCVMFKETFSDFLYKGFHSVSHKLKL